MDRLLTLKDVADYLQMSKEKIYKLAQNGKIPVSRIENQWRFRRDKIAYGCEIKNTLAYIDKKELEIKLEMCKFFKIRPLFIMRYSPKTYNNLIIKNKGFALIFEAQIYDLSQKELVRIIKENLHYEVDCPRTIPSGIIDRFDKFHNKLKNR